MDYWLLRRYFTKSDTVIGLSAYLATAFSSFIADDARELLRRVKRV
jgi:hypothetical protein